VDHEPLSRQTGTDWEQAELIARARRGDEEAWEVIVRRHSDAAWKLGWMMVREREAAEDVVQETFVRVRAKLSDYRGGSFRSWILAICRNQARDELRRRGRRACEVSLEGASLAGEPQEDRWADLVDLHEALDGLPEDEREALLLQWAGLTSKEIADTLGVAPTTIRSRIARGREKLVRLREERREKAR
jgi:RNA polymerase sigma-70 factor (ECF subfamily)